MTTKPVSKLLLADDDQDDRDLFSEALASLDPAIDCQGAVDGKQALQYLSSSHPELPSVIFLDINMPVMNGWEVLRNLKGDKRYIDIPVIVYTTSSGERERRIAADLGALCFVTKPDSFRKVQGILEVVINHLRNDSISTQTCTEIHRVLKV